MDRATKIAELNEKLAELRTKAAAEGADQLALVREAKELVAERDTLVAEQAEIEAGLEVLAEDETPDDGGSNSEEVADDAGEGTEEVEVEAPAEVEVSSDDAGADNGGDAEDAGSGEGDAVEDDAVQNEPVSLAASASAEDVEVTEGAKGSPFTLTAGAGYGNISAGSDVGVNDVIEQLNRSMRFKSGKERLFEVNNFAQGAKVVSATNSAIENTRIIHEAREAAQKPLALTAAACFCGPDQILPDFDAIGSTARPVASIFPTVPINGGFRYFKDIAINPDSESVNLWTCDDQDLVDPEDPDTWKQCSELDCFTDNEAYPYMIVGCTQVQRTHNWAHPEQVQTWLDKLRIEYARKAEVALLDIIQANAGTSLTVGAAGTGIVRDYGIKAQLQYALASLAFSLGYQFRAEALAGHVVIAPRGFVEALIADEQIRGLSNSVPTRAQVIQEVFDVYGVRLVERLDEPTALQTAAAATVTALNAGGQIDAAGAEPTRTPLQPPFYRLYVLRPDQFVHAQGTLVGADWHVDKDLLLQNKMLYFWENLELLEWTGLEKAYAIDVYGCINGARADLVWPACATVPDPS